MKLIILLTLTMLHIYMRRGLPLVTQIRNKAIRPRVIRNVILHPFSSYHDKDSMREKMMTLSAKKRKGTDDLGELKDMFFLGI